MLRSSLSALDTPPSSCIVAPYSTSKASSVVAAAVGDDDELSRLKCACQMLCKA